MPRKDGSPFGPKADAVIDRNGKFVIRPTLKYTTQRFSEGLCVVRFDGNHGGLDAGVITPQNKVLVAPGKYSSISKFIGGVARVVANGKIGCIDSTGKVVIPAQFDQLWEFEQDAFTTGELHGRKFIVDRTGRCVHEVCLDKPFDISCLRSGLACVEAGGKVGFVNFRGELAVPIQFDRAEDFRGELALVKRGAIEGYINRSGEFVWQTTCWDEPIRYSVCQPLSDFLPPGTLESLPLEYNWDRVKNAIVFASNAEFRTLQRWFIKQFGSRFKLSVREDPAGCLHIDFFGDGVLGSFHAVDVGCENAKSFVGHYSSRNMALLDNKHSAAVVGILIQDG